MVEVLSPLEARVLGVLLEKEVTTPEVYPMTINAIMTGCNQKSNRDPVLSLSLADVTNTLDRLQQRHWVLKMPGARTVKYKQRFCNTEFSAYQFSAQERAILCLLLLRGPQTPGELRSRCLRMADFADVRVVEACLRDLENREKGALVFVLGREPGRRESRYATTLLGDQVGETVRAHPPTPTLSAAYYSEDVVAEDDRATLLSRVEALEQRVAQLEALAGMLSPADDPADNDA